jgi:hypothetical protein
MSITVFLSERYMAIFLFMVAALTLLASMLLAPIPLSLDGPSHIYGALVMRHLFAGETIYRQNFQFTSLLIPNWLTSLIAAVIAMPEAAPWSILVMNGLTILLIGMGLLSLIRRCGNEPKTPEQRYYLYTILTPLAMNVFVILGYWGFLISTGLCLIAVAVLKDDRFVWRRIVAPVLILLGVWAHPVPVMLTALIPIAGYARAIFEVRRSKRDTAKMLTAAFAADMLPWCLAGVLIAQFIPNLFAHGGAMPPVNLTSQLLYRLIGLARPEALSEVWPTVTVGGLFIAYVGVLSVGAFAPSVRNVFRWQLTVFLGMLLVLYFIVPDEVGSASDILRRILWIAILITAVISVSGVLALNVWYLRLCAGCAAAITILVAVQYLSLSLRMEPAVQELRVALANVPIGSKTLLLGYRLAPRCDRSAILEQTAPERHWALMEMIPRQLVVLNSYEPAKEYFPVKYRDQRFGSITDEFKFTVRKEAAWRDALESADPGTFILSWGVPSDRTAGCEDWLEAPLWEDLRDRYELRYQNANHSRVQVWERRYG